MDDFFFNRYFYEYLKVDELLIARFKKGFKKSVYIILIYTIVCFIVNSILSVYFDYYKIFEIFLIIVFSSILIFPFIIGIFKSIESIKIYICLCFLFFFHSFFRFDSPTPLLYFLFMYSPIILFIIASSYLQQLYQFYEKIIKYKYKKEFKNLNDAEMKKIKDYFVKLDNKAKLNDKKRINIEKDRELKIIEDKVKNLDHGEIFYEDYLINESEIDSVNKLDKEKFENLNKEHSSTHKEDKPLFRYLFFGAIVLFILISSGIYKDVFYFLFRLFRQYFYLLMALILVYVLFFIFGIFFSNNKDK